MKAADERHFDAAAELARVDAGFSRRRRAAARASWLSMALTLRAADISERPMAITAGGATISATIFRQAAE